MQLISAEASSFVSLTKRGTFHCSKQLSEIVHVQNLTGQAKLGALNPHCTAMIQHQRHLGPHQHVLHGWIRLFRHVQQTL